MGALFPDAPGVLETWVGNGGPRQKCLLEFEQALRNAFERKATFPEGRAAKRHALWRALGEGPRWTASGA